MTRFLSALAVLSLLSIGLPGCSGRAHLAEDSGSIYKRTMSMQARSRPSLPLAPLGATDAKIIVQNHEQTNNMGGGRRGSNSRGTQGRGGSSLSVGGVSR